MVVDVEAVVAVVVVVAAPELIEGLGYYLCRNLCKDTSVFL